MFEHLPFIRNYVPVYLSLLSHLQNMWIKIKCLYFLDRCLCILPLNVFIIKYNTVSAIIRKTHNACCKKAIKIFDICLFLPCLLYVKKTASWRTHKDPKEFNGAIIFMVGKKQFCVGFTLLFEECPSIAHLPSLSIVGRTQ